MYCCLSNNPKTEWLKTSTISACESAIWIGQGGAICPCSVLASYEMVLRAGGWNGGRTRQETFFHAISMLLQVFFSIWSL